MIDRYLTLAEEFEAKARKLRAEIGGMTSLQEDTILEARAKACDEAAAKIRAEVEACEEEARNAPDPS